MTYDFAGRKVLGFNIDSLVLNKRPLFEKKINEKGICSSVQLVNNTFYYTSDLTSENRIFSLDTLNNKTKGYGSLLLNYNNIEDYNFGQACRAYLSHHNNKFITAYRLAPFFEIYNSESNKWTSILTVDDFPPAFKESEVEGYKAFVMTKNTKLGFIDISLSNDFIYLLYSGHKMDDNNNQASTVLVFDYEGNPKEMYELDSYITSFEVFNDSIIYALGIDIKAELLQFKID